MRKVLYILCQCTWGIVQSLVGGVVLLINIRRPHRIYHGAIITEWKQGGSVSLGMFVFLSENKSSETKKRLLSHEYGHTIQSLILGPLYLLVIGLPSVLWAGLPVFERLRQAKQISYYRFYTERWADMLSAWALV